MCHCIWRISALIIVLSSNTQVLFCEIAKKLANTLSAPIGDNNFCTVPTCDPNGLARLTPRHQVPATTTHNQQQQNSTANTSRVPTHEWSAVLRHGNVVRLAGAALSPLPKGRCGTCSHCMECAMHGLPSRGTRIRHTTSSKPPFLSRSGKSTCRTTLH